MAAPTSLAGAAGRRLGGLPRAFWLLWTGTLVNRLGTFVEPFLALYLTKQRGLSVPAAGLVLSLLGVGALCSQLIGGTLADRIGRRATISIGMWAAAGSLLLLGAARTTPQLLAAALVAGLALDIYRPASSALVADLVPPADRPRAFALLFWAVNLGFAVATSLAGFLAESGYTLLFVLDALTSAAFGVVVWRGVPETRPATADPAAPAVGYRRVLHDRLLLAVVGLQFAGACVYFQVFVTLPLAMRDAGLPASAFGLVIAINGLVIVLVQPLVAGWLGRLPRVPLLAASQLVIGLGFGLTAFATGRSGFAGSVVVWTLGEIGTAALAASIVADLAPPLLRGRYSGLFGMSFGAAAVLAPVAGTAVYHGAGADTLWACCAVVGAVVAALQLSLGPAVRRRTAAYG